MDQQLTSRRARLLPSLALVCCLLLGSAGQAFSSFDSQRDKSPDREIFLARRSTINLSQWSTGKLRASESARKNGYKLAAPKNTASVALLALQFISFAHPTRYFLADVSTGFGRSPPSLLTI